jgi:hypothetical protein
VDLTQKYAKYLHNQSASEFIAVIGEDPPRTFTYKCLLCEKDGAAETKIFEQKISNKSLSNFRRHLRKVHDDEGDMKTEEMNGDDDGGSFDGLGLN